MWFFFTVLVKAGQSGRRDMFRQLASKYRGHLSSSGWFSRRALRFQYAETPVIVVQDRRNRIGRYTDVWFHWPDPHTQLHICPVRHPIPQRFVENMQTLDSTGDQFYWRNRVHTLDSREALQILSETVKWHIEQLRQYLPNRAIEVRVHRGRLLVRKHAWFKEYDQVDHFVSLALGLYDQMILTRSVGIEFVDNDQLQPIESVRCQVCGEEIVTDMVFCRRCKTPHHRECWDYTGICSVYGCRETEYVMPRVAAPTVIQQPAPQQPTQVEEK